MHGNQCVVLVARCILVPRSTVAKVVLVQTPVCCDQLHCRLHGRQRDARVFARRAGVDCLDIWAVSYTHLDVYKRQIGHRLELLGVPVKKP